MATPLRNVRVPAERWDAAMAAAKREGTTLTAVINRSLDDYIATMAPATPGRPRSKRTRAETPAPVAASSKASGKPARTGERPATCDHAFPVARNVAGQWVCKECG